MPHEAGSGMQALVTDIRAQSQQSCLQHFNDSIDRDTVGPQFHDLGWDCQQSAFPTWAQGDHVYYDSEPSDSDTSSDSGNEDVGMDELRGMAPGQAYDTAFWGA